MAFELPNLPYDYDALAPYMSRETLEYHHDKHHLAYVTNGNKLAEKPVFPIFRWKISSRSPTAPISRCSTMPASTTTTFTSGSG